MKRYLFTSALHSLSVVVSAGMLSCIESDEAYANPQGGVVRAGAATIQGQGTPVVQVTQATDRAVIDWKSFDIAPGESTRFRQPTVSSVILNRIHDQNPSQIMGNLSANGKVMLINPNGMVFGKEAQMDVAGLVATSANISDAALMQGKTLAFDQPGNPSAAIVNQGSISVRDAGLAALVAPRVVNDGVITAKTGRVTLGAGDTVTLDLYGDGLVSVAASEKMTAQGIMQSGRIAAPGGEVRLAAAEAVQVMDGTINMTGLIDAGGIETKGGAIIIQAGGGMANVSGTIHADSHRAAGGGVEITGKHIRVDRGAVVTASGATGGGTIKIGGDYQGGGALPHAGTAFIAEGARIDASATGKGDGGRVIVWSDENTTFDGRIEAKGGQHGGNGGFIETSSKGLLSVTGSADASASHGLGGEWLLDPNNITINATADANVAGSPNFTTSDDNAVVTVNSIQTALNVGTSVSITTGTAGANTQNGDITVASSISKTAGGDATLTLKAHRNITVNNGVNITSNTGELNMVFNADGDAVPNQDGAVQLGNGTFTTNGGDFTVGGGANPLTTAAYGNAVNIDGVALISSQINAGGGNISMRGVGYNTGNTIHGVANYGSTVQTNGNGTITVHGIGGGHAHTDMGVYVSPGGTFSTVDGAINITGIGGGGGSNNHGVWINGAGSAIRATGIGNVNVTGTGTGTGANNYGVYLLDAGTISVVDGIATVIGQGSTTGTGSNYGVYVTGASSAIKATGSGDVDVTGTGGGSGAGASNYGVYVDTGGAISGAGGDVDVEGTGGISSGGGDLGVAVVGSISTTGSGNISATGTGRGTGSSNYGVYTQGAISVVDGTATVEGDGSATGTGNNFGVIVNTASGVIKATGSGHALVTGAGGGSGANSGNYGVYVLSAGTISSVSGNATVDATGGSGSANGNSGAFITGAGSAVKSTGGGNVSVTGTGGGTGDGNSGVLLTASGAISGTGGTVTVIGHGSNNGHDNVGFYVSGGTVNNTGSGNISATGTGHGGAQNGGVCNWIRPE